ncbi:hypothetical protein WEI85_33920 [Actinomycetes bacterium KLBMP 9797]
MPAKARECIGEAVVQGYVTSRSCFYLLLALCSGRTVQQMADADFEILRALRKRMTGQTRDVWTDAIRAILRLIDSLQTPQHDPRVLVKELSELGLEQRDEVARHLEIFLHGPLQDWIWQRAFERARHEQCETQRTNRVWRFFQPEPAKPRVRWPRPATTGPAVWVRCVAATALLATAVGFIAQLALRHDWLSTAPALLLVLGAFALCGSIGVEWRYRTVRLRAKDSALLPRQRSTASAGGGFANKIDRLFNHYFAIYVPSAVNREDWLAETSGVRRALRDEIVELYRESRIGAKRVAWLVRYLVSDVKTRWQEDRLWEYRDQLRIPVRVAALFLLGAAAFAVGVIRVVGEAAPVRPFSVAAATGFGLAAGWLAGRDWLGILVERRRFAAEMAEAHRLLDERIAAYERWCRKLASKPSDLEMARWLDCDRKVLMEQAMRHYKLAPRNIIAHAFIEAPAPGCKRARVRNGPWRYSRYRLLIFLLTADGVRQMSVDLDFEKATFHNQDRLNYRYDAVAAVQVVEADDGHKTFELTLVNGHPIEAEVLGSDTDPVEPGEDRRTVSRVTLDAAGLGNTLHVLEGIAAEGKKWIHHERQREEDPLGKLAAAVHAIVE